MFQSSLAHSKSDAPREAVIVLGVPSIETLEQPCGSDLAPIGDIRPVGRVPRLVKFSAALSLPPGNIDHGLVRYYHTVGSTDDKCISHSVPTAATTAVKIQVAVCQHCRHPLVGTRELRPDC